MPDEFDPSPTFSLRPLPAELLVGRESKIVELLEESLLASPPLVSLVGPSKIGRTSLLLKLRDVAKRGVDSEFAAQFKTPSDLLTPFLDLELLPDGQSLRHSLSRCIADELEQPPDPWDLGGPAALDAVMARMIEVSRATTFLLIVDGAERLLTGSKSEGLVKELVPILEKLTVGVPSFGLVLSFGASNPPRGEARPSRGVDDRERQQEEFVNRLSNMLYLALSRMEIGLLDDSHVREYASKMVIRRPEEQNDPLDEEDLDWLVVQAGGHPYVLNLVGDGMRHLRRGNDGEWTHESRDRFGSELLRRLRPFVERILERLELVPGAVEAAFDLAAQERGLELSDSIARQLEGEGIASSVGASNRDRTRMQIRSLALRGALKELRTWYVPARGIGESPGGGPAVASPPVVAPSLSLSLPLLEGGFKIVRLTRSEVELLSRLMSVPAGEVVPADQLLSALGPKADQRLLTKRLSVLRAKLREELEIPNPIQNFYGQGYAWVGDPELKLRRD